MGEFVESDDYSDLYGDVELQLRSAISAIQAVSQSPVENNGVYDSDDGNVGSFQEVEEGVGGLIADETLKEGVGEPEDGNGSETEDDFSILLNDDVDYHNCNGNGNGNVKVKVKVNGTGYMRDEFTSGGTGGKVGTDDDEYANVAENKRNLGVENGGGTGGNGGCYKLQYNYAGYNSTTFPYMIKSNGSAQVPSCLSTFVGDDWESNGSSYKFEKSCIGPQSRRNFSLPPSRTILDININTLDYKPWRNSGVDITDFFNFGFDEDSWKSYCNHLDSHRDRRGKVTAAYKNERHRKEHGVEVDYDYQQRELSLASEISCRLPKSEMLKGRDIQVEDSLSERQPSIDVRLPVHRDSDAVIEIPVQDLEEGGSNSYKVPFNGISDYFYKGNQEVGVNDAGDILYSSKSQDELLLLDEPTRKSNPHRHTSKDDGDPHHLDSDSCESLHVSDANDQEVQATRCDFDGLAEEIKSSGQPEKSDGKGNPAITPKKKPETSHSQQTQQRHCSSPSQIDYVGSRDGAYVAPNKFHNHPKLVSQTSASDLWETSKDSTNCVVSMRSDYKDVARSRSPVIRDMRSRLRRSSLMDHLDDERPLHMSDGEDFYDGHYRAVDFHKQRKRHHDVDSCIDKDYLYHKGLTYQGARFFFKTGSGFAGYSFEEDCRYKRPRYTGGNMKRKQAFPQQRTQRLGDEVMQQKWNYRQQNYVQEMDSSNYDMLEQLITEDAQYLYNRDYTPSRRKANEFYINRRIGSDDFSAERSCDNKFTEEKFQPMAKNWRERDYLERRHDRELSYTTREAKSTLMNRRRYGNPFHDHEGIWHTNSEDESCKYGKNQLYFHSYLEPQTIFRGLRRTAPLSRNDMIGRHGRQKRQNCVERYRGSNKLDDYAEGYNIQHTYDHDSYVVGRSKNWESEVLYWSDQENDRHQEDNMEAVEKSYLFGRTSSCRKFDSRPNSFDGRLVYGRESSKRRYELPIVGDRCSQFDRNPISVYRNNLRQAPPSCWDPADSHIFVGNRQSSSCSKAGNLMCSERYDILDWNDDLECEIMNGFCRSHFQKVIQSDSPRIDGFHNKPNWAKKLSVTLHKHCLDFEEGQIVTNDFKSKSRRKGSAVNQIINIEELEKSRIMEILAKMEKRRKRFQQPLVSENVENKNAKPVADSNGEAKVQRPARKRKWGWQLIKLR